MARRVILSDDFTGLESDDVKPLVFSVNEKYYEIDLGDASQIKFTKAIKPFIDKARETTRLRASSLGMASAETEANAIREWAKANGKEVAERGRIPQEIKDEYAKAMADQTPTGDNSGNSEQQNAGDSGSEAS